MARDEVRHRPRDPDITKSHLYEPAEVTSDGPAESLCAQVRAYGPFETGVPDNVCQVCQRMHEREQEAADA